MERIVATYRLRSDPAAVEARADALALEQSIEAPRDAVRDDYVAREIVAQVLDIRALEPGSTKSRSGLSRRQCRRRRRAVTQHAVWQLSSLQSRRRTARFRAARPDAFALSGAGFWDCGSAHACDGALTCVALKPQGLSATERWARSRKRSRWGASISSRTITASPTKAIRRSPSGCAFAPPPPGGRRSGRGGSRVTSPASAGIMGPCATRSRRAARRGWTR